MPLAQSTHPPPPEDQQHPTQGARPHSLRTSDLQISDAVDVYLREVYF
jgi:hypothetical protein